MNTPTPHAIIDIGTNTAHLLIGTIHEGKVIPIHKDRQFTFLAEEGMDVIGEQAQVRLHTALYSFYSTCNQYNCKAYIIATEALRKAKNKIAILREIKDQYGWPVNIITGKEEAQYCAAGVMSELDTSEGAFVIVDIGGGSVEFIYVNKGEVQHMVSKPLGIARLYDAYYHSEPIEQLKLNYLNDFLSDEIKKVFSELGIKTNATVTMVGCTGTFDIFKSDAYKTIGLNVYVSCSKTIECYDRLKELDLVSRRSITDVPKERAKYITVALALIKCIATATNNDEFIISQTGIKEGVMLKNIF